MGKRGKWERIGWKRIAIGLGTFCNKCKFYWGFKMNWTENFMLVKIEEVYLTSSSRIWAYFSCSLRTKKAKKTSNYFASHAEFPRFLCIAICFCVTHVSFRSQKFLFIWDVEIIRQDFGLWRIFCCLKELEECKNKNSSKVLKKTILKLGNNSCLK